MRSEIHESEKFGIMKRVRVNEKTLRDIYSDMRNFILVSDIRYRISANFYNFNYGFCATKKKFL